MIRFLSGLLFLSLTTAYSQEFCQLQLDENLNDLQTTISQIAAPKAEEFDVNYCIQVKRKLNEIAAESSAWETSHKTKENNPFEPKFSLILKEFLLCQTKVAKAYTDRAFSLADQSKIDQGTKIKGISALKIETIQALVNELLANPYFPYETIHSSSCFLRADFMSVYLARKGVVAGQIRADGKLTGMDKFGVQADWDAHTAIYVLTPKGIKMIIDPSLSGRPITEAEWLKLLTVKKENAVHKVSVFESKAKKFSWKRTPTSISDMEVMSWALIQDSSRILKEHPGNRIESAHDDHFKALSDYTKFMAE
jgi:hypothetical protein